MDVVSNNWGTNLISRFDYTNDPTGRRVGREDSGQAFASTQANSFGYNSRSEVITANMRNGNSSYTFDQIGNRESVSLPGEAQPRSYQSNSLNQYLSVSSACPELVEGCVPVVHPSYDLDGNMLHGPAGAPNQILGFKWNGENRMIAVTNGNTVVHNTYDSQGRRVRKLVTESGIPSKDIRWLYDGWNPIFEFDVLSMSNTKYYAWGLDLSQSMQGAGGVGGLLFVQEGSNINAATYDANGNVSEYVDLANGSITAHLEYDAFGRVIATTGSRPCAYGFSTKYGDAETGLLYYGFRYYDPETGRWPNRDPIGERGGLNVYGFVGNDPIHYVDIFGWERLRVTIRPGGTSSDASGHVSVTLTDNDGNQMSRGYWPGGVQDDSKYYNDSGRNHYDFEIDEDEYEAAKDVIEDYESGKKKTWGKKSNCATMGRDVLKASGEKAPSNKDLEVKGRSMFENGWHHPKYLDNHIKTHHPGNSVTPPPAPTPSKP